MVWKTAATIAMTAMLACFALPSAVQAEQPQIPDGQYRPYYWRHGPYWHQRPYYRPYYRPSVDCYWTTRRVRVWTDYGPRWVRQQVRVCR